MKTRNDKSSEIQRGLFLSGEMQFSWANGKARRSIWSLHQIFRCCSPSRRRRCQPVLCCCRSPSCRSRQQKVSCSRYLSLLARRRKLVSHRSLLPTCPVERCRQVLFISYTSARRSLNRSVSRPILRGYLDGEGFWIGVHLSTRPCMIRICYKWPHVRGLVLRYGLLGWRTSKWAIFLFRTSCKHAQHDFI